MGFKCGILGLSNVGKSTVFNALTATAAAQASNYPFSTIEPNVGEVMVPDPRLDVLARLAKSAKIKPTRLTFVDIAGLVSGSSKGEGLGNQFLAHVREVDAIAHVVRCFVDADVAHVSGAIDPVADIETIETELMLADLDSLERRVEGLAKKAKGADRDAQDAKATLDQRKILSVLPEQRGSQPVVVERHDDLGGGSGRDRTSHERSGVGCTSCQRSNLLCRPMPDAAPPRGPTPRIDCSIRHR